MKTKLDRYTQAVGRFLEIVLVCAFILFLERGETTAGIIMLILALIALYIGTEEKK